MDRACRINVLVMEASVAVVTAFADTLIRCFTRFGAGRMIGFSTSK
jgi:hypothetical protein